MANETRLNSVATLQADATSAVVYLSMTVYNTSYTHTLTIKRGGTTVVTINNITVPQTGNITKSVTLTSTQKNNLLSAMSDVAQFSATYVLQTFNNGSAVGSTTAMGLITVTESVSKPTLASGITYADTNASTVAVTGSNQKLIANLSTVAFYNVSGTAKNGASVSRYIITYDDGKGQSVEFNSGGTINLGTYSPSPVRSTEKFRVTVRDTRGFVSDPITVNVATVYSFTPIIVSAYSAKRNTTDQTKLNISFSGTYDTLGNNAVSASYKYKPTSSSTYSADVALSPITTSGTSFSFALNGTGSFDGDTTYDFVLTVSDSIASRIFNITIPTATTLIAFRENAIGIGHVPTGTKVVDIEPTWELIATGRYKAVASQFLEDGVYGVDMNDSDITNVNAIYTHDQADAYDEGINFLRQNGNWDRIYARNGVPYFMPDIPTGGPATSAETILTTGSIADYVTQSYTSGIWKCRVWASGLKELWGTMSFTISGWTKYGQVYYSNNYAQEDYPSGFFASGTYPVISITGAGKLSVTSTDNYWGNDTSYHLHTPQVYAVRYDNAYTGVVYVSVHAYTEVS